MSTVDVGDAIQLTMEVTTGATVTATWLDPAAVAVFTAVPVTEDPVGSGKYPYNFVPTRAGVWTAVFTAAGTATAVERHYVRALPVDGLPPLATLGDVAELYGTLPDAQLALVGALLRHASRMLRNRFADLDERINTGALDPGAAALAAAQMVMRVLRNPTGMRSETVGPFSRTFDTGAGGAAGMLAITAAEVALLADVDESAGGGIAGTIRVTAGLAPPVCSGESVWSSYVLRR